MSRQQHAIITSLRRAGFIGLTTFDLFQQTGICDPIRRVRELQAAGWGIEKVRERRTASGANVFRYRFNGTQPTNQGDMT